MCQNSGPISSHLWTKVHQIKFAYVCSLRHFPTDDVLLSSGDICDRFAKLSEVVPKFRVFGPRNFGLKGPPKFQTKFYQPGSPSNVAKFGDDWPSYLGDQAAKKNKQINDSGKTEWPTASIAGGRP